MKTACTTRTLMVGLLVLLVAPSHGHANGDHGLDGSRIKACHEIQLKLVDGVRQGHLHEPIGECQCLADGPRSRPGNCTVHGADEDRGAAPPSGHNYSVHDMCQEICWTDTEGNYQCERVCQHHEHPEPIGPRG